MNVPESVRVLSIDPGTTVTGYASSVYHLKSSKLLVRSYGKISPSSLAKKNKEECNKYGQQLIALSHLREEIHAIIKATKPDFIVSEDAFLHPQRILAYAALKLCIMTMSVVARDHFGLPIYVLAPCHIKKVTAGIGSADKAAIQHAILNHPNVEIKEKKSTLIANMSEHEADAIAVGIAFIPNLIDLLRVKG